MQATNRPNRTLIERELTVNAVEDIPGCGLYRGIVRDNYRPEWVYRTLPVASYNAAIALALTHAAALRDAYQTDGITLESLA